MGSGLMLCLGLSLFDERPLETEGFRSPLFDFGACNLDCDGSFDMDLACSNGSAASLTSSSSSSSLSRL